MCFYSDGEVEDGTAGDDESDERLEKRKAKVRVELWPSLSNPFNFVQVVHVCVACSVSLIHYRRDTRSCILPLSSWEPHSSVLTHVLCRNLIDHMSATLKYTVICFDSLSSHRAYWHHQLRRFAPLFIHSPSGATGVSWLMCRVVCFRVGAKMTDASSKIDIRRQKVWDLLIQIFVHCALLGLVFLVLGRL